MFLSPHSCELRGLNVHLHVWGSMSRMIWGIKFNQVTIVCSILRDGMVAISLGVPLVKYGMMIVNFGLIAGTL